MAGVLQFALGLESSNFLREIGVSSRVMVAFAGIGESVKSAFESMFSAMERGERLGDLSARTGETTANLYQLEEALKACGLSADSAAPMILKVRKALSGVNEMGGKTNSIFAALGLDRQKLASESPLDAIQKITAALHKLNPNDAVGASNGLFGRNAAGDFMQMAGSAEHLARSLTHTKTMAGLFSVNVANFREVGDLTTEIKSNIQGMWAGLASGLAPELIKDLDQVSTFTAKLGPAMAQAVKDGGLQELISLGFMAGIEKGTPYLVAFAGAFTVTLTDAICAAFKAAAAIGGAGFINNILTATKFSANENQQKALQNEMQHASALIKKYGAEGNEKEKAYWVGTLNSDTIKSNRLIDEQGQIEAEFKGTKAAIIADAIKDAAGGNLGKTFLDNYKPDTSGPTPLGDAFLKKLDTLSGSYENFLKGLKPAGETNPPGKELADTVKPYKPEVTDLEKIGFIFGSGNGGGDDSAVRTARATEDINDKMDRQIEQGQKFIDALSAFKFVNE